MLVMVVRGRSVLLTVLLCFVAGFVARVGVTALSPVNGDAPLRALMSRVGRSYGKQVATYTRAVDVSVSPLPVVEQASPDALQRPPTHGDNDFRNSALEYKLQTARERSQRLEELEQKVAAQPSGAHTLAEVTAAEELIGLLNGARAKEEAAQGVVSASGLGEGIAAMGEDGLRVFVHRTLTPDGVASLGERISRATDLPLEKVVIAQRAER